MLSVRKIATRCSLVQHLKNDRKHPSGLRNSVSILWAHVCGRSIHSQFRQFRFSVKAARGDHYAVSWPPSRQWAPVICSLYLENLDVLIFLYSMGGILFLKTQWAARTRSPRDWRKRTARLLSNDWKRRWCKDVHLLLSFTVCYPPSYPYRALHFPALYIRIGSCQ